MVENLISAYFIFISMAAAVGLGTYNSSLAHFHINGDGPKLATKHAPICFLSRGINRAPALVSKAKANRGSRLTVMASSAATETEKLGIKIVRNPPESKLSELGVRSWPKWGCPPSNFPWTYSAKETCYLLKGKVKVYPEGSEEGVEIGAGDLVVFPKGMSCTWDVSETVDKHYQFE